MAGVRARTGAEAKEYGYLTRHQNDQNPDAAMQGFQDQYGPKYTKDRRKAEKVLYSNPGIADQIKSHIRNDGSLDPAFSRQINRMSKNSRMSEILLDALRDRGAI